VNVLLLHALPLDERMWEPQLPALAEHDVKRPRLYGRGPTMTTWAESIAADLDGEHAVVGASMGGYCALALAKVAPELVSALLLVGSRPDPDSPERRAGRADTIELIRREGADGLWRFMEPKLFASPANADPSLMFRDPDGLIGAVEAIRDREDSTQLARDFPGPLQFVVGEHENFVTPGELSEFDIRIVPEAGHLVNLERPDEFNGILREFLARV
jgi:pimeloyl-ACP methyl ester carboxylesterase